MRLNSESCVPTITTNLPRLARSRERRSLNDHENGGKSPQEAVIAGPLLRGLTGGCAQGYFNAGFDVVGVDIKPQPRYPFPFIQCDALELLDDLIAGGSSIEVFKLSNLAAIHASPPCQKFSAMTQRHARKNHPDLIEPCRALLKQTGLPYIIENVPGAPLQNPTILCGTFFGLRVIRHRLFESNRLLLAPSQQCQHPPRGSVGRAGYSDNKKVGDWISVAGHHPNKESAMFAMGINWKVTRDELAQMIPPAYTEFIGRQLLSAIEGAR